METVGKKFITSQKELLTNCRDIIYPIYLQLANGEELRIQKALRVIPKKRLTAYGVWNDKEVVVKLFFSPRKAKYYAKRDSAGIAALVRAEIPTPNLLYAGPAAVKDVELLIFEYLDNAENFTNLWRNATDSSEQLKLLVKILRAIAKQHKAGLVQEDLHSGNFMLRQSRIYSLDGDALKKVTRSKRGVAAKKSLKNVAMLIAQLSYVHDVNLNQAYLIYSSFRNWPASARKSNLLYQYVHKQLLRLRRKFLEKTLRECTSFATSTSWTMRAIWAREQGQSGLPQLLPCIDQHIQVINTEVTQTSDTSEFGKLLLAEKPLLVKKYQPKHWLDILKHAIRKSSAKREWINAHCLQLIGASALKPLAICEKGVYPYFSRGYLITEYIEGTPLGQYVEKHQHDETELTKIFNSVGLIMKKLARSQITCSNVCANDFLVANNEVVLINLDKIQQHVSAKKFSHAAQAGIQTFIQSWPLDTNISALAQNTFEQLNLA